LWAEDVMQNVFETLKKKLDSIKGAVVETNVFCVSAHYRQCENEEDEAEVEKAVDEIVAQNKDKLRKHSGKKVWEVKPKVDWDKGKALSYLLEALKLNDRKDVISMYLGDDVTDEDAFEVLRKLSDDETQGDGVGIVVTKVPKQTKASYSLRDTDEVFAIFNQSRKHRRVGRRKAESNFYYRLLLYIKKAKKKKRNRSDRVRV
jgi:trehalose 6-phosphate phosphatase